MQIVINSEAAKNRARQTINQLPLQNRFVVTFDDENRTLEQNAAQWPILNAFAEQLLWPVNGEMTKLTAEDWKNILTAAFRKETRVRLAQGLDGGVVMLGLRTSKFTRKEFPEWLEFLNSIAADRGVKVPISKRQSAMYGE